MKQISLNLILFGLVSGHSNMLSPPVRGNKQWWGYCSRGQNCNTTCDAPKSQAPFNSEFSEKKYVERGGQLPVEWLRQNHPGGFVRLAFAKFDSSDDGEAFNSNSIKYVCYETNCREDHHDPMLGELNGPGFKKCSTSVTIPDNLPDGPITLQWTWYGGGVYYADQKASFANYVSCSDMIVKGGKPYQDKRVQSEFQGGDVATSDPKKCRYWATNSVFGCPRGAEDYDKNGCGYSEARFGAPLEWLNSAHSVISDNNQTSNSNPSSPGDFPPIDAPLPPTPEIPVDVSIPFSPAPPIGAPLPPAPEIPVDVSIPSSPEPTIDVSSPELPVDVSIPFSPAPPIDAPLPSSPELSVGISSPELPIDTTSTELPLSPPSPSSRSSPKCHRRKHPFATPQ